RVARKSKFLLSLAPLVKPSPECRRRAVFCVGIFWAPFAEPSTEEGEGTAGTGVEGIPRV
ncbi:MAG: hypothetical protein V3T19_06480, partial [Acidiferrobacterales bacterium]